MVKGTLKTKLCSCCNTIKCCCHPGILVLRLIDNLVFRSKKYRAYRAFTMILVTLTNLIVLPFRCAFDIPNRALFIPLDVFLDIFYVLDIIYLLFRYEKPGKRERLIDCSYLRGRFILDVLSVLPLEIIPFLFFGIKASWFRLNRLLKFFICFNSYFSRVKKSLNFINLSLLRFVQSCIFSLCLVHITGCVYLVMMFGEDSRSPSFIPGGVDLSSLNVPQQYIRCFYIALITITGYFNAQPQTNTELIFSFIVSAYGLFVYIIIISGVGSLISEIDVSTAFFQSKMDEINEFFRFRRIHPAIARPVRNYYNYVWKSRGTLNEEEILDDLPVNLRVELVLSFILPILRKISLFLDENGKLNPQFINSLALKIKPVCAPPGAMVIRHGQIGREMFFVSSGKVEVLIPPDRKRVVVLGDGKYFGDVAILLKNTKRTAWVRSITYTDLYVIHKDDFIEVLKSYPTQEKIVRDLAYQKKMAVLMMQMMQKKKEEEEEEEEMEKEEEKEKEDNVEGNINKRARKKTSLLVVNKAKKIIGALTPRGNTRVERMNE